ncbi:MAG: ribonuclease [Pseudobdellovibrio sp.]|jgi:ribonuclease HII|nr:ribonuclease [Pseudobdellovibrio sp.]
MSRKLSFDDLPAPLMGVDEVGRGCLAGPVVAGAVIFKSTKDIRKYRDSKDLTEEDRDELSQSIHSHHFVSLGWATVEEIDQFNILQATFIAMRRAVEGLKVQVGSVLVDGNHKIPNLGQFEQRAIIGGDEKVRLISAASIVAKVARDRFMKDLALEVSHYGFESHKGYATPLHRKRIQQVGPCKWHRQTFAGVKEYIRSST